MPRRKAPDMNRLSIIAQQIAKLQLEGLWTPEQYDNALTLARKAAHGHNEQVEFVHQAAQPSWRRN